MAWYTNVTGSSGRLSFDLLYVRKYLSSVSLLAITACLLWSTAFVGVKTGLRYSSPLNFAGMRFMLSGLMILIFTGGFHSYLSVFRSHSSFILKVSFFQTFLIYALFYIGLSMAPASIAAMINGSSPLFVAILAHFLVQGEKFNPKKLGIILLGLAGVGLIVLSRGTKELGSNKEFIGVILLILANLSGSYGNILVSNSERSINPLILTGLQIFIGGLSLFLISLPVEGFHFPTGPLEYWLLLLYLGFLSAAAFSIWFTLLSRPGVKVSALNIWKFLIPLCGALLGWILLSSEKPELLPILGMVLICIALVWMNWKITGKGRLKILN
jgi:drug/metabolite transporter (DMT)-like permease